MHEKAHCCSINNPAANLGWWLNGVSHTQTHTLHIKPTTDFLCCIHRHVELSVIGEGSLVAAMFCVQHLCAFAVLYASMRCVTHLCDIDVEQFA
jgi:hypothetical protein